MRGLRSLSGRPWGRAVCAAALIAVMMLALWSHSDIAFETNDDSMIAAVTSGALTGAPHPATVYTSYLYGLLLCGLYGLCAALPWHGVLLLAINVFSLTVILSCLFDFCHGMGQALWRGLALFVGLFLGVYLRFVAQLQFTAVSGMAFVAGLLLLWRRPGDSPGRVRWLLAALLLLFSFLLRPKAALMLSPFLALFALSNALRRDREKRLPVTFALCALCVLAGLWLLDGWLYGREPGWAAYQAYDAQTTAFLDYNAYGLTDDLRVRALEAAGWSEELFQLAQNWYFLDERIDTPSLNALNAVLKSAATRQPFFSRLFQAVYAAASVLRRYPMFGFNLLAYAVVACVALTVALRQRNASAALWIAGSFGGAFSLVLVFYGFLGRFPLRLAFPVAAVLYTPLLPCFGSLCPQASQGRTRRGRIAAGLAALLLAGNLASFALHFGEGVTPKNGFSISRYNDRVLGETARYVAAHPDQVFVTDLSLDFLPFTNFPAGAFSNLIFWGSGIHSSPAAMAQLRALGYERFDASRFFDENVRLLLTRSPGVRERLESYLQRDHAAVCLEQVDETEDFAVYRAIR